MVIKDKNLEGFLKTAEAFIFHLENINNFGEIEFIESIGILLLQLYSFALKLPNVESEDNFWDKETDDKDALSQGFMELKFSKYEIFSCASDPYDDTELVQSSLSDCLQDIYRDLQRGLSIYKKGCISHAIWEWKFNFEIHWGIHTIEALRAIHSLLYYRLRS